MGLRSLVLNRRFGRKNKGKAILTKIYEDGEMVELGGVNIRKVDGLRYGVLVWTCPHCETINRDTLWCEECHARLHFVATDDGLGEW